MRYILQVFTGNFTANDCDANEVIMKLDETLLKIDVSDIIIGWSTKKELYKPIVDYLHRKGKQVWLWLPVFSDVHPNMTKIKTIDIFGKLDNGNTIMQHEDFSFGCPTSQINIDNPINTYRLYFDGVGFDGVFLDKIRSSSFNDNFATSLGCFCDSCREKYQKYNIDIEKLKSILAENPENFIPYKQIEGRYFYPSVLVNSFYKVKSEIITRSVCTISASFRKQGFKIGLDVYAPLFAYFVGQDITELSKHADFIKPMMYRITNAPAGIPYEYDCIEKFFESKGIKFGKRLKQVWNLNNFYDFKFLELQMQSIQSAKNKIYPGFEINYLPEICESSPNYVRESAEFYEHLSYQKAVLSWNLLANSAGNIGALSNGH